MSLLPEDKVRLGPGGPFEAAFEWRERVFRLHDLSSAWEWADPNFRLALVQSWILSTGGTPDDQRAQAICRQHADWPDFSADTLRRWLEIWPVGVDSWSTVIPFEIAGLDLELVSFTPEPEGLVAPSTKPITAMILSMRFGLEWGVAGIGSCLAVPGWPPTESPV
jgi:hypothetical protein